MDNLYRISRLDYSQLKIRQLHEEMVSILWAKKSLHLPCGIYMVLGTPEEAYKLFPAELFLSAVEMGKPDDVCLQRLG